MDDKSNLSEHKLEIDRVKASIENMSKSVENSKRIKRLLNLEDFKIAIIDEFIGEAKLKSIDRLVKDRYISEEIEKKILSELRSLKELEQYIYDTANSLENRELALLKEKQHKSELLKNQNQTLEER